MAFLEAAVKADYAFPPPADVASGWHADKVGLMVVEGDLHKHRSGKSNQCKRRTTTGTNRNRGNRRPTVQSNATSVVVKSEVLAAAPSQGRARYAGSNGTAKRREPPFAGCRSDRQRAAVQHLGCLLGAKVSITLEIEAEMLSGPPDNAIRTLTENCRTLKFENSGFEEE